MNDEAYYQEVHKFLREEVGGTDGQELWLIGQGISRETERKDFYNRVILDVVSMKEGGAPNLLKNESIYKWQPVSVEEFVCGEYYLNKRDAIYPKVLEELIEINTPGKYVEIVLTGGIGSAKTTTALYTTGYQLYLLSCMHSPHKVFGLDSASEILIVFQSINSVTSAASFKRFKSMIEGSDYFKEKFPFDKDIEKRLIFPHRIEVVPVSGMETAVIGQNVIGGMIDELNYMSIVNKSKQSVDQGTYNQAVALYNSIARRRKSRFISGAEHLPGLLCLVSSKRYPGQFTDIKEEEAKREIAKTGSTTIYIYDYRVWDIKPPGTFTKGFFKVFSGDLARKPRILLEGEKLPEADAKLVVDVPKDFLEDFRTDIINALREIAGVSTLARHPYFVDVERVTQAFGCHQSVFSRESVDFVETHLQLHPKRIYRPDLPRFAHVDLAVSGDSAGLTIGTCTGFASMKKLGFGNSDEEMMPKIHIDGVLEVKPPKGGEILFWKIRDVLMKLRTLGVNVRWVTFDSFQSKDSQQLLRQAGFIVGEQSMDINSKPYDFLKGAIYTGRVRMPEHHKLKVEMMSLEKDTKTGKVDHPATGSKDCSDSLAGVVFGLTMRREIWGMYGIALLRVPDGITLKEDEDEKQPQATSVVEAGEVS